jgi:preprotein translocase subunit SecG
MKNGEKQDRRDVVTLAKITICAAIAFFLICARLNHLRKRKTIASTG